MHECPCINVLSMETSSCLNVETEPRMKLCGGGETERTENMHLGKWHISVGHYFINMCHTEKFQITKPSKIWVSGFPSVDRNGILATAIMKNLKNCHHFVNMHHTE